MTQAETMPKPFELSAEQQKEVTKIQDDLGKDLKNNTSAAVKTACELMENLGIPKQEICHLVCQRAEEWDYSEGHLRRFVPIEYKNQAQREVRLTHEGGHDVHQHETATSTKTLEVRNGEDFKPINPVSSRPKGTGSITERLKNDLNQTRMDFAQYRFEHGYTFIYECVRDGIPELELGKKVKDYFLKNKWYLSWLKTEKAHEASLNVKGKTREQAYLDNLKEFVDKEEQKEEKQKTKKIKAKVKK